MSTLSDASVSRNPVGTERTTVGQQGISMLDLPCMAWQREATRLAEWAWTWLVNRTDVFGRYLPLRLREPGKSNDYTAPSEEDRRNGALGPVHPLATLPRCGPQPAYRAPRHIPSEHLQMVPR